MKFRSGVLAIAMATLAACGPGSGAPSGATEPQASTEPAAPAAQPEATEVPPEPAAPVGGPTAERLAFWKGVRSAGDAPPAGEDSSALAMELVGYLGLTDPAVRDGLAYEVLATWIQGRLPRETVRAIGRTLLERLSDRIGAVGDDSVFGRSFAALVLSVIAARELEAPGMSDDEITEMVTAARTYASKEMDLRGYVEGRGWAHAAAHTADWLKFLSRHPRLGRKRGQMVLDAVLDLTVRPHGHIFHHGEDGRLAQPVMDLLRRRHVDGPAFSAWLTRLLAPLGQRLTTTYDPALFASQRNARNLAFTLFVALSLEDARNPIQTAALAALTKALRG